MSHYEKQEQQFGSYQLSPVFSGLRDKSVQMARDGKTPNIYSRIISRFSKLFNRPYDVDWDGIKLRLFPKENSGDRWIFRYGIHSENEDLVHLRNLYAGRKMSVVDIGANIGVYSLFLSTILDPESTIISFEPHPLTYSRLVENISFNQLDNIMPINAGVGERDETARLYSVKNSNLGANSLLPGENSKGNTKIELRSLAGVLKEKGITHIDLLKIDIEGYEDKAFLPFIENCDRSLLPKHILIEDNRHQWETDCFEVLLKKGYEITRSKGKNGNTHFVLP